MRCVLGVLGVTALAGVAGAALAEPSPQPLSLVYVGPASCLPETEFVRRLRSRLGASQVKGQRPRTLDVRIVQADGQFVGRLSLIDPDGRSTAKTLSARNCDDLVDALALVAALAVEADDAATSADERPATATPAPSGAPDSPRSSAPDAPVAQQRPLVPPAPPAEDRGEATARGSRFGVRIGGLVAAGPAPAVVLGGVAGVDWAWVGVSVLSPAVGLGLVAGAAPDVPRAGGKASFAWFAARVDACALRLTAGEVVQIRGCFLADIGLVDARGSETTNPASSSRGWLSLGGSSELEFPVGTRFALHVVAGVEAPLRRDRYAFGAVDFFEVPVLIATGSVGVATHF